MDALDFGILRGLSPGGRARYWGGRRVVDPRISARALAQAVGVGEARVEARLRDLERRGFLRGTEFWPNPSLFGAAIAVSDIPVRETREVVRLFDSLRRVDGVTFARDVLDEQERKVQVFYAAEAREPTAARTEHLRALAPSGALEGPRRYWIPACEGEPSPDGWRLLRAFRTTPDASLAEVADALHLTVRAAARECRRLIEARAAWWTPDDATEEIPSAWLTVALVPGVDPTAVARWVARNTERWMPVATDGLGVPPSSPRRSVSGVVLVDPPSSLEGTVHGLLDVPGVEGVRRRFVLGSVSFRAWIDARLEEAPRRDRRPGPTGRNGGGLVGRSGPRK